MRRFRRSGPATADLGRQATVNLAHQPTLPPVDAVARNRRPIHCAWSFLATTRHRPVAAPAICHRRPSQPSWSSFLGNDTLLLRKPARSRVLMPRPSSLVCTKAEPASPPAAQPVPPHKRPNGTTIPTSPSSRVAAPALVSLPPEGPGGGVAAALRPSVASSASRRVKPAGGLRITAAAPARALRRAAPASPPPHHSWRLPRRHARLQPSPHH
jgi:hypothetical protein